MLHCISKRKALQEVYETPKTDRMAAHKAALCTVLCTCAVCRSWIWWSTLCSTRLKRGRRTWICCYSHRVPSLSSAALIWLTKYVIRQLNNGKQYPNS